MSKRVLTPRQSLMEVREREYRAPPAGGRQGRRLYLSHGFVILDSRHNVIWTSRTDKMTEQEAMEYASDVSTKMLKNKLLISSDGRPKTEVVIHYIKDSVRVIR